MATRGLVCPRSDISESETIRHLLLEIENIFQIAGIKKSDADECGIFQKGYMCTCGTVIGIRKSDGKVISLCALEMQ